jgi:ligand-binding sensor domain-containing protein
MRRWAALFTAIALLSNTINKIVADSRGFIWFCTAEGLSRFDGYRFVNFGVAQWLPQCCAVTGFAVMRRLRHRPASRAPRLSTSWRRRTITDLGTPLVRPVRLEQV